MVQVITRMKYKQRERIKERGGAGILLRFLFAIGHFSAFQRHYEHVQ